MNKRLISLWQVVGKSSRTIEPTTPIDEPQSSTVVSPTTFDDSPYFVYPAYFGWATDNGHRIDALTMRRRCKYCGVMSESSGICVRCGAPFD